MLSTHNFITYGTYTYILLHYITYWLKRTELIIINMCKMHEEVNNVRQYKIHEEKLFNIYFKINNNLNDEKFVRNVLTHMVWAFLTAIIKKMVIEYSFLTNLYSIMYNSAQVYYFNNVYMHLLLLFCSL